MDGCILSPFVEIFRGNTDQGYAAHTKTVPVTAVVSVAMYNKNWKVRDAPVDAPSDPQKYEEGVRKKFTTMLHAAALSGADSIIIPDVGCGVFQNDPHICGKILGETLFNYASRFRRAVFTGKEAFYHAAMEALRTTSDSGIEPMTADLVKRGSLLPMKAEAHLYVGKCVVCGQGLASSDFASLAILLDKAHKSHQMQFLHDTCVSKAGKKFPKHQPMLLPDITKNAKSFLMALDLNGNGFVEKQELRCICALLWEGDLSKDVGEFERDFEQRFKSWDADQSGSVDLDQLSGVGPKPQVTGEKRDSTTSICLQNMPQSCFEWVQEQAKKHKAKA